MKFYTEYLDFNTKDHREYINITEEIESFFKSSGIKNGMILVAAMHNTSGIFINDDEVGFLEDLENWLQKTAPFGPNYHHHRTGEINGDAHLKSILMNQQIIIPVTDGKLDLGSWQEIFYAEFDGERPKKVILKAMGE